MKKFLLEVKNFMKDENGLTTAEWVILASAVTVAAIAVVGLIMPKIRTMANKVGDSLSTDPYDPNAGN